jgi:hypothetical protein
VSRVRVFGRIPFTCCGCSIPLALAVLIAVLWVVFAW